MSLWRVQAACLGRRGDGTGRGGAARRPGRGVRTRPRPRAVASVAARPSSSSRAVARTSQARTGRTWPAGLGRALPGGGRRLAGQPQRGAGGSPRLLGRWRGRPPAGGVAVGEGAELLAQPRGVRPQRRPLGQHAEQGRTQRSGQPRRTRWVGHDRRQRLPRLAGAERGHSFHREVQGRGQRPQVGRRRRAPGRWPGSRPGGRPPAGAPRPGCPAAQGRAARPGRSAAAPPARPAHAATARRPAHHQQRPAVLHEHVVQHHRAGMAEPGRQPRLAEHPVAQPRPSGRRGGRSDAAHPCLLRQRAARTGSGRHRRPERAPRGAPRNGARGAGRSGQETGGLAGERRTEAYSVFGGVGSALCGTLLVLLRSGDVLRLVRHRQLPRAQVGTTKR